jgi:hypothetical protein
VLGEAHTAVIKHLYLCNMCFIGKIAAYPVGLKNRVASGSVVDLFYHLVVFYKGNYPYIPSASGAGNGINFIYFHNKPCQGPVALF